MIRRAAFLGALLALCAAASAPSAQEAPESVNLRVREIVKAGQGALLPLGDALGTAREVPEEVEDVAVSIPEAEPEAVTQEAGEPVDNVVDDQPAEPVGEVDAAAVTEEAVVPEAEELAEPAEEVQATETPAEEADAVAAWPPPADEVEVAGFEETATGDDVVADEPAALAEIPEPDEPEAAAIVAEPAVEEAESFDAGLVPLRTAELGNPQSIGPYRLWLASYKTVRQAKQGWQDIAVANQDLLADLTPIIVLVDLGAEEGTFFRLQVGPLQTQDSAVARCESLQERSLYCSVLGP
jgi:hypothetical protein